MKEIFNISDEYSLINTTIDDFFIYNTTTKDDYSINNKIIDNDTTDINIPILSISFLVLSFLSLISLMIWIMIKPLLSKWEWIFSFYWLSPAWLIESVFSTD